uniref:Eukaryotic translation initiation factor 1 n=1 Tax=Myotis myotis TaxID=51298 RepID=A0A7J7T4E0_MYOMY|nr:eukaryotic translation initiation factor 1 [Myotis myotis]
MSAIQNLHSFDPFADASKGDDLLPAGTEDYIHIRIQQRNGRKTLTTVQGIADDYDKKKLVKAFKKKFACNGTVIEHPEYGEVIQLQGDQRKNICQFLVEETSTRTTSGAERCDIAGSVIHRGDRTKDRRSASPGNWLGVQNINRLHTPAEPIFILPSLRSTDVNHKSSRLQIVFCELVKNTHTHNSIIISFHFL